MTFLKICAESFLSGFASTQGRVKNNLTQLKLLARDRLIDKRHLKLCTISVLMLWYTIWKSQCYVSVQCSQYLVSMPSSGTRMLHHLQQIIQQQGTRAFFSRLCFCMWQIYSALLCVSVQLCATSKPFIYHRINIICMYALFTACIAL